ncbi:hypothetical protein CDD81_780 [Ophiocordyceps australis]|uniref:LysM domain-containing protein n=1 Tax=Ophiocordyceps australis TaxID=1399860 RepID=A0A2C5XFW1_9HYPO|nr:hypothetical protein CDD81_780 [Ophiocordyceps australis]
MDSCCTCATILSPSETHSQHRIVECCNRIICAKCIQRNPRFSRYCPFCQISSEPSPLPQRLRDPPPYTPLPRTRRPNSQPCAPPPYTPSAAAGPSSQPSDAKSEKPSDTLHFLDHDHDSISSLSLRYGVPQSALRSANNITSDHLLLGRKTILIPAEYYTAGISLSPLPINGEDEELRKAKIRRFMTSCKESDYDVALLYLEQSDYDVAAATASYLADEAWEKSHPKQPRAKQRRFKTTVPTSRG